MADWDRLIGRREEPLEDSMGPGASTNDQVRARKRGLLAGVEIHDLDSRDCAGLVRHHAAGLSRVVKADTMG